MTGRPGRGGPVHELLASVGVLTAVPVARVPARRAAILGFAPLVGAALGGVAAGVVAAGHWLAPGGLGALLSAAVALAVLALLTRGLHLDGLADTADALGVSADRERALEVARRGDVGPFGVVAVVLVLLVDAAALARDTALGRGPAAVLVAVVCGRLVMLQAGTPGVPAARPTGLGAWVAGSVRPGLAVAVTVGALGLAAGVPAALGDPGLAARFGGAVLAGIAAGWLLRRRAVARLGGITGDVLGALGEVATAVALAVTAIR